MPLTHFLSIQLRKIERSQLKERDQKLTSLFIDFLKKSNSLIDIGTGWGSIPYFLSTKIDMQIYMVDLKDKRKFGKNLVFLLCSGEKMPFKDSTIDGVLLCCVLHHSSHSLAVLKEAVRISKERVIVIEDTYENALDRYQLLFADSLINRSFRNHPHANKTVEEWLFLFKELKLTVLSMSMTKLRYLVLFHFTNVCFVLEKENKPIMF